MEMQYLIVGVPLYLKRILIDTTVSLPITYVHVFPICMAETLGIPGAKQWLSTTDQFLIIITEMQN